MEPPDQQVDRLDKVALVPGVIPALLRLRDAGYEFVMVSNQDGRGTPAFPEADFQLTSRISSLGLFGSQGILFARSSSARTCRPRAAPAASRAPAC